MGADGSKQSRSTGPRATEHSSFWLRSLLYSTSCPWCPAAMATAQPMCWLTGLSSSFQISHLSATSAAPLSKPMLFIMPWGQPGPDDGRALPNKGLATPLPPAPQGPAVWSPVGLHTSPSLSDHQKGKQSPAWCINTPLGRNPPKA